MTWFLVGAVAWAGPSCESAQAQAAYQEGYAALQKRHTETAGAALDEARGIAQRLGSGPESDLGQLLAEVDDETESTI